MKTTTSWVVMKISNRPDAKGHIIQEAIFANTKGQIAHTYLDESNRNYQRWKNIIRGYDEGFGIVVTGLRIKKDQFHKKTGEPLVDADSLVKVIHVEDDINTLLKEFVEQLKESK